MAAFEVQTTEIHLLLNPAQISVRAKQFQLKVKRQSDGLDITSGAGVAYSSASSAIATVDAATGLIQAVSLGETYCRIFYTSGVQQSHMIIRVVVHADIASASGQYLIYNGDQRITTYKSRQTADDEFSIYYTPTVYAKFTDGLFGDISCHPYLKYDEVNTNGTPLASTPSLLAIDKELFSGSTTEYYYPGLFRCMTAGPVLANMGTHRGLKITLQGIGTMVTDTSKLVGIRCEDELDKPRFLLRRVNNEVVVPDGPLTQVLFLGEGYDTASQAKFLAHCQDMITFIRKQPPYDLLKDSMEFWYAPDASGEVGVTVPSYVNVDGGKTQRLIPGGFNYFYEYGNAVKQLIREHGIYTGANDSDGNTFFTNNSGAGGVTNGLDQVQFMEKWKSTKLEGFVQNKDTRLCITLGEGRLSEAGSEEGALPTSDFGYWLKYPDTYDVAFDRRKTFMVTSGKSAFDRDHDRLFINTYIGSLREQGQTDPTQGISGDLWTNIDRDSVYRRTFVVILVNHPMEIGVNSNNYCVTTVADNKWLEVGSPQNGVFYPETVTTDSKSVSISAKITFAHELTHFFNIGDEYSDVRSQGHENFTPSESLYSSRIVKANIDSFDRLQLDGTTTNEINPYKVKWNWPRIATASATLNRPEVNPANQIVLNLISAAEANKWIKARDAQTFVYLRTVDFPLFERKQLYDFVTLGEGDIFRLRVTAINSTTAPFSVTLAIVPQGTATIAQCAAVIEDRKKYFRGEACLYAKQKGLYRVQSVKLKTGVTQPGAIFQTSKEGRNLKLSIRGTVPSSKYALNIILKIKPDGTCEDAFLDPKEKKLKSSRKTVFIDKDQNIADTGTWDADWFQASSNPIQHPILDFEFVPYDTSLSRINVINPGNGYSADPIVNISPANGAVAKPVMSAPKVFPELDTNKTGGSFIFPVYLEAIDLRNKDENQKGSGLLALVTELDSNGAIVNYSIVNNGNGLYSSNAAETQIKITTDGHDYIGATTAAEFVFDPAVYKTWIKGTDDTKGLEGFGAVGGEYVPNTNKEQVIYYCPIKYKMVGGTPRKGAGYQIPLGPMRFTLCTDVKGSVPISSNVAHVLGYLNSSKEVEKVEILFGGKGYHKNQILQIHPVFTVDVIYIGKYLPYYYRHNSFNEAVPSAGEGDRRARDTQPVFEVLDVDADGAITQLGFSNNQRGANLHYPTQEVTAIVSDKGSYDAFLRGDYGKFDFSFVPQPATPANARAISKVNLLNMANAESPDRKIRVFGGKPTVTVPTATSVSFPCDPVANVADILVKQGKSVLRIDFVNNQRGSGFTEENPPAVSLSGGTILAGGAPADIQMELSLFPRIVDPSVLKYMEQHKAPLIANKDVASVGNALKQIFSDAATDSITLQNKNQEALIAIYEGAGTFNKKAYRPSFDSLMRNSSRTDANGVTSIIPMNFVTMYYLVNYLNASKLGNLDHDQYFKTISYTVK